MPEITAPSTTDQAEKENRPGRAKSVIFYLLVIKSMILVPVLLLASLLIFLLTSPEYYASILRHSDLISTFVKAKKWGLETQIREEIEKEVQLESFKREHEKIKGDYEDKKEYFDRLTKTGEYDRLELQRKELKGLNWKKAPDVFKSEDEFRKYRKEELDRLDAMIDDIESYRKQNRKEIGQAEDDLDDARDAFEDSLKTLEDKEEQARKIVLSHENSLTGKIYADLGSVSPILSRELNEKIVDGPVKNEIDRMISFMTTYHDQVRAGNVYRNPFNINLPAFQERVKVIIPETRVSLWVEDTVNGIRQKRHLLSEIFVEKIEGIPDLRTRDMFVNLFRFSESGLGESIGRSYLGKAGLTIRDGVIIMDKTELSGRTADIMEKLMIGATCARYAKFAFIGAALLLMVILAAYPVDRRKKLMHLSRVLIYPSLIMLVAAGLVMAVSWRPAQFFPNIMADPLMSIYAGEILFVLCVHVALPVAVVFGSLTVMGLVLRLVAGPSSGGDAASAGAAGEKSKDAGADADGPGPVNTGA